MGSLPGLFGHLYRRDTGVFLRKFVFKGLQGDRGGANGLGRCGVIHILGNGYHMQNEEERRC